MVGQSPEVARKIDATELGLTGCAKHFAGGIAQSGSEGTGGHEEPSVLTGKDDVVHTDTPDVGLVLRHHEFGGDLEVRVHLVRRQHNHGGTQILATRGNQGVRHDDAAGGLGHSGALENLVAGAVTADEAEIDTPILVLEFGELLLIQKIDQDNVRLASRS